ncbi:Dcp1 [Drosophila busckii]|uniref:Dcp1 n=1 Tax=Drosophila busckii TaxID=30019 RepID=A0A0M3QVL6_DROBS|nr:mRNA-decapping enzyme 1A [Drosophila busckii]ALC42619.1 Dcp1 [Drosophila busckii]
MADESITRMNLSAIKKIDPYAKEIVDSSSHVAFYTFNSEKNEWDKTDVEGAFFIYHRNAEPFHSIFINNRLNTNSFVEPIAGNLELKSQPPFLLYRNERSRIRGFWFYNREECIRISKVVNSLLMSKESNGQLSSTMPSLPQQGNSNIFNMLSQAQKEYNAQIINQAPSTITQCENVTPCNVMKFFESAKQATVDASMNRPQPLSVDQLEKLQRSVTPNDGTGLCPTLSRDKEFVNSAESPISPFIKATTSAIPRNLNNSISLLNELKFDKPIEDAPASALLASDEAEECLRRLLVGDKPADSKPALMPPTMFDVPNTRVKPGPSQQPIQPLNTVQFVQAFTYLIHNDKEFVKKLHNAYVHMIDSKTTYQ